jgi:glyoxylase-like metal-dependent hydrolase (beta-lactamase superfamily II)
MSDLDLSFLEAGFTRHVEAGAMRGGSLRPVRFPASVAVIEHPREGVVLFDTGYSPRFHEQTKSFPNRFYSLITPVTIKPEETAAAQLKVRGISPRDVRHVILSHFHADHIGGVADFPQARYVYRAVGFEAVRHLRGMGALRAGFLSGLLPQDFLARSRALTDADFKVGRYGFHDFDVACDLFGDGSVLLVDLPGHAIGQIGLLARSRDGRRYFLVADACWGERAYREMRLPSPVARVIFANWSTYKDTLGKIHRLSRQEPELQIVPCHCDRTLAGLPHVMPGNHVHV